MATKDDLPKGITPRLLWDMAALAKLSKALKIEKRARWKPAMVEIEKGQENSPEHLKKLAEIKEHAERCGWDEKSGPYVFEVILNHDPND